MEALIVMKPETYSDFACCTSAAFSPPLDAVQLHALEQVAWPPARVLGSRVILEGFERHAAPCLAGRVLHCTGSVWLG